MLFTCRAKLCTSREMQKKDGLNMGWLFSTFVIIFLLNSGDMFYCVFTGERVASVTGLPLPVPQQGTEHDFCDITQGREKE